MKDLLDLIAPNDAMTRVYEDRLAEMERFRQAGLTAPAVDVEEQVDLLREHLALRQAMSEEPFVYGILEPETGKIISCRVGDSLDKVRMAAGYLNESVADGDPKYRIVSLYAGPPAALMQYAKIAAGLPKSQCGICSVELTDDPTLPSFNCGGDCLKCMAESGDPDCILSMEAIEANRNRT